MSLKKYFGGRINYVWKVEDPDLGRKVRSPSVTLDGNNFLFSLVTGLNYLNEREWCLHILHRRSNNWRWKMILHVKVRYGQLAFLTCAGSTNVVLETWRPLWCGSQFNREYIVDGNITFVFTFDEFLENITDIMLGEKQIETECLQKLSTDIGKLCENCESADALLECQGELFPVHQNILKIRSRTFFEKILEKKRGFNVSAVVSDMDYSTLRTFLKFLYSGSVDLWSMNFAVKLYLVASRYHTQGLIQKCRSFMVRNLSVRNVCEIFALASQYQDVVLMQCTVLFAAGDDSFLLSNEWFEFACQNTEVAVQLFNDILSIS